MTGKKHTFFFGWNAPTGVLFEEIMYCHMVYVVKTAYTLESIVYCMYMYYLTTPSTEYTDGAPKNQKKLFQ